MVRLPANILCPIHGKMLLQRRIPYSNVAISLFHECMKDDRLKAMCRKDPEGKAMIEDVTPTLAQVNPLCCFVGGKRFMKVLDGCRGSQGRA